MDCSQGFEELLDESVDRNAAAAFFAWFQDRGSKVRRTARSSEQPHPVYSPCRSLRCSQGASFKRGTTSMIKRHLK